MNIEETIRQIVREENKIFLQELKDALLSSRSSVDSPEILTVEQAAKILKMGKTSVYELTQRVDFPAIRDGRKVRIPYDGLMNWIQKNSSNKEAI
ncbi:excisionase family DNA binding protein [Metabacillus crassostreae]|uniref:helix-turn-helix domain-containing protein n=1 Tax=Metabacillus crassostreae TaxID=929098 RepID=UPI00195B82FC|nr:helix-turn-helix domain-containing protein [Metabacillus crassostreae]MBM7606021.1 excisionase family DNA binding protein [Metabacillus crassostreae]